MYKTIYTLNQDCSDGVTRACSFTLPSTRGKYRLTFHLSDGTSFTPDPIEVQNDPNKRKYKLDIEMSDGYQSSIRFYAPYGLSVPKLTAGTFTKDSSSGTYGGTITVYNPNPASVDAEVWYKEDGSDRVRTNGTFTLAAGASKVVRFSDLYSTGILVRVNFLATAYGVNANEIFEDIVLGQYDGTHDFYGVGDEESSSTTTTTTTTTTVATSIYMPAESDGIFTLWRVQDVK